MKLRLAPVSLATRFQRPLRFGRRWRGHELPLRIVQLALIVLLAGFGAKLVAQAVAQGSQVLAGLLS
jgi:hypothetical protein